MAPTENLFRRESMDQLSQQDCDTITFTVEEAAQ